MSQAAFDFGSLDLSDVKESGDSRLRPGIYLCTITGAEITQTKSGGTALKVELSDSNGAGSIGDFINLSLPGKKPEAERIGRERLKSLCIHARHPNPDKPGNPATLIGLKVGVRVESQPYIKDGVRKDGSGVADRGGYFTPNDAYTYGPTTVAAPSRTAMNMAAQGAALNDDIPF